MQNSIFQSSWAYWLACLIFLAAFALGSVSEARFVGFDSVGNYRIRLGLKPSTGVSCGTIVTLPALPAANQMRVRGDLEMPTCNQSQAETPLDRHFGHSPQAKPVVFAPKPQPKLAHSKKLWDKLLNCETFQFCVRNGIHWCLHWQERHGTRFSRDTRQPDCSATRPA